MEDLMDMDMRPLRSQNYLFGCELKADKDYHFTVDNDENEHQLSLRTASLGAGAKDELLIVEAEAMDYEGSPIKVTLATLKMSVQPTVLLGVKLAADEDDDDDDDDNDDEDDDEDDIVDDFDDEKAEEKTPVKKSIRDTPAKNAQKSNQNGKDSKPSTPRSKGQEYFKKQEKTPKTPKGPSSVEDIKAKMQASIEKGGSLPKVEAKFINYVKNCFWMTDQEAIQDLWQWRKSL
ncbi:Nucleophosmin [Heterocephalus glaber]|uniref:Nucleophosmin n=1 Tax=Heterocephalus glaber TaxID=10181 RepID=G5B0Y1_HETGA|nr:Nucleophosmin [Heterocephalus glaber]